MSEEGGMGEWDVAPPTGPLPDGLPRSRAETALGAQVVRDTAIAGFFDRLSGLLDRLDPVIAELEAQAAEERREREARASSGFKAAAQRPGAGETMRPRRFQ